MKAVIWHLGEALDEVRKSEYTRLSGRQGRFSCVAKVGQALVPYDNMRAYRTHSLNLSNLETAGGTASSKARAPPSAL